MVKKEEFIKAFRETMAGKRSTGDFAKLCGEYLESPDFNRWKAAQAAEDLKRWREGRDHLMNLIEMEKKAGTAIDTETVKLREGHDSVCVLVDGKRTVCFPSFFGKEFIDLNWTHVMEAKKNKPCGHEDCKVSTAIDDMTITFGRGDLHETGFWEIPCLVCAEAFKKSNPKYSIWPVKDAPQQG